MPTFSELGLSESLCQSLAQLGFEEPTPIQTQAVPALLTGSDVLGMAATGTGKTAAFALPLLERYVVSAEAAEPLVLVLTPTRELCLQVSEAFHNYGKEARAVVTPIYGGQDYGRQIRALKRGTHVVVATPGRALDHIRKGTLALENVQAVVLDEADEMLDLGFADELDEIFEALPDAAQKALFSATLPPKIARIAESQLRDPLRIKIERDRTNEGEAPRVPQIAYVVGRNYRLAALGRILDLEGPDLAIIFTRTRMEVDELTESLRARGYSIEALHGGLDQPTRDRVMKRARAGQIDAIVATDVAARGIDLENLTHVINYGIPASVETYVHRIGRTGRAGRTGTAITILEPREHRHLRGIERITKARIEVRSVPSATDVRAKRLEMTRGSLAEILVSAQDELEHYQVILEELAETYDIFDIAAAAVKLAEEASSGKEDTTDIPAFAPFERKRREDGERSERAPRREKNRDRAPEAGMTRLFLGIGREARVRPGDIVGAIANEIGLPTSAIGAIDISDHFTLLEVESALAQDVMDGFQRTRVKGRPVQCRLDNGGRRSERRERDETGYTRDREERYERSDGRSDRRDERFAKFDRFERRGAPRFDKRGPRR